MPLTSFQKSVLAILAPARSPDSYLAGGTALHLAPESVRYSRDFDFFHDLEAKVAETYSGDRELLEQGDYQVDVLISQPGHIRATVGKDAETTQIDWARDSAWRFLPIVKVDLGGFVLHEVDLATNKLLALAGRDEARDFVDILYVMDRILPLGPLIWAAVAKDPGYSPHSLLEQVRKRGKYRSEELDRLDLVAPLDLQAAKQTWIAALSQAEAFVDSRPPNEAGCLYYSFELDRFVEPRPDLSLDEQGIALHFGRPGGVLPRPTEQSIVPD